MDPYFGDRWWVRLPHELGAELARSDGSMRRLWRTAVRPTARRFAASVGPEACWFGEALGADLTAGEGFRLVRIPPGVPADVAWTALSTAVASVFGSAPWTGPPATSLPATPRTFGAGFGTPPTIVGLTIVAAMPTTVRLRVVDAVAVHDWITARCSRSAALLRRSWLRLEGGVGGARDGSPATPRARRAPIFVRTGGAAVRFDYDREAIERSGVPDSEASRVLDLLDHALLARSVGIDVQLRVGDQLWFDNTRILTFAPEARACRVESACLQRRVG